MKLNESIKFQCFSSFLFFVVDGGFSGGLYWSRTVWEGSTSICLWLKG